MKNRDGNSEMRVLLMFSEMPNLTLVDVIAVMQSEIQFNKFFNKRRIDTLRKKRQQTDADYEGLKARLLRPYGLVEGFDQKMAPLNRSYFIPINNKIAES
jgi:hypothetical protein